MAIKLHPVSTGISPREVTIARAERVKMCLDCIPYSTDTVGLFNDHMTTRSSPPFAFAEVKSVNEVANKAEHLLLFLVFFQI